MAFDLEKKNSQITWNKVCVRRTKIELNRPFFLLLKLRFTHGGMYIKPFVFLAQFYFVLKSYRCSIKVSFT